MNQNPQKRVRFHVRCIKVFNLGIFHAAKHFGKLYFAAL